ncbi:hypothetical protein D3C72_1898440 [compost metagenome]
MLAHIRLVEPFQTRVAQSRCPIVVLGINGTVNVFEALVQLLRVPEIHRHHSCRDGATTTKNYVPDDVRLSFIMQLNMIHKHAIQRKPLRFRLGLNEIPVEIFARIGLALALPQRQKLLIAW